MWADMEQEHLKKFRKVLQHAEDVGLRFNKDKCKVNKSYVEYVWHIISLNGVKPSSEKIKAILSIPAPENKKKLQKFMGMINYIGEFIPNLSAKNQPLILLLDTYIAWNWDDAHEKPFNDLKRAIIYLSTLIYFDVNIR